MDEPLSNGDALLRGQMGNEILKLHRRDGRTTVYVTHDQLEAMTMADRIVVMKSGVVQKIGRPSEVYRHPANTFVAGFVGSPQMNLYGGWIDAGRFCVDGLAIPLDEVASAADVATLGIRPEDVLLCGEEPANAIAGMVTLAEPMGPAVYLSVTVDTDQSSVVRVPADASAHERDRVRLRLRPERLHLFDSDGKRIAGR